MSRKHWIIVLGATGLVATALIAAAVVLILVPRYRSQDHLERAAAAVAAGNVGEAKRFYREYLYLNPEDIEVLEDYASLCVEQLENRRQNLTEAGRAYLKVVQLNPDDEVRRQALLDFYNRYQFWDDLEVAVSFIQRSVSPDAELRYQRAVAIQGQGRTADAVVAFEQYLEDPEAPRRDIPLRLARIHQNQERVSQAVALLERERESRPEDMEVAASYANYLMDIGDLEGAANLLPESIRLASAPPDFVQAMARLKNLQEDYAAVVRITRDALADAPEDTELHLTLLLAMERQGEREAALAHIETLDPALRIDAPGILIFQVEVLLAGGQWEAADAIRTTYRDAYPGQGPTDEYLNGRIAFARGLYAEAHEHFVLAAQMNPNLHRARYYQALSLLQLNELPAARVALELYLRNNPDDRQARQLWSRNFDRDRSVLELRTAGQRLLGEGAPSMDDLFFTAQDLLASGESQDKEMARGLVEKALLLNPGDPRGYTALAGYHLEEGDVPAAVTILNQAEGVGIDRANFALLDASIALLRGDEEEALAIGRRHLASSDASTMKQWATFFSRRGYTATGQRLVGHFAEGATDAELADITLFGVELTLQFGALDAALEQLRAAEVTLADMPQALPALNRVRISIAQRLLGGGGAAHVAAADEIQAAVIASDPEHNGLHILRARKAMRESPPNLIEVERVIGNVDPVSSYREEANLILAEVALLQGHYDRSERLSMGVADRAPNNKAAWHLAGDAQLRSGRVEAARASLERVLEIDRSDDRAMRSLVRIYSGMQLRRQAEAMYARYRDLVALRPESGNSLADLRAMLDMQAGDYAAAESNLREQLAANPRDYSALNGLARALALRGQQAEAVSLVRAFVAEQNPTTPEPWTFFGQLLLDQRDGSLLGEASSAFTKAQLLVPGFAPAQVGNIEVQARLGNDGVAIAMSDRYLADREAGGTALSEQDAQIYYQRAALRAKSRSGIEAALDDLGRALAVVEAPRFLSLRATVRASQGDAAGAIADLRRIGELSGALSVADQLTMAEAYLGTGDLENARRAVETANVQRAEIGEAQVARIDNLLAKLNEGGI